MHPPSTCVRGETPVCQYIGRHRQGVRKLCQVGVQIHVVFFNNMGAQPVCGNVGAYPADRNGHQALVPRYEPSGNFWTQIKNGRRAGKYVVELGIKLTAGFCLQVLGVPFFV